MVEMMRVEQGSCWQLTNMRAIKYSFDSIVTNIGANCMPLEVNESIFCYGFEHNFVDCVQWRPVYKRHLGIYNVLEWSCDFPLKDENRFERTEQDGLRLRISDIEYIKSQVQARHGSKNCSLWSYS